MYDAALTNGFQQIYYFCQKFFFEKKKKNPDMIQIKRALVLKGIFSDTEYMCVL